MVWDFQQCGMCNQQRLRSACTVWSESLPVAWIFYGSQTTNWISFGVSKHKRRLHRIVWVYTCQNATLLEISCHTHMMIAILFVLLLYIQSQQLWSWRDGQFTQPHFFLDKLEQAVNLYFVHIFSLVTEKQTFWKEENDRRNYFRINLHESMGPGQDQTRYPWICSQIGICSKTRYRLRYAARYDDDCFNLSKAIRDN